MLNLDTLYTIEKLKINTLGTSENQRHKVLVIDNDQDTLDMLKLILESKFNVVTSASVDVLDELENMKPDIILVDNLLNGTTGCIVCKSLKSSELTSHIPVYVISAMPGLEYLATEAGADGYLSKPFDIDELVQLINDELAEQ